MELSIWYYVQQVHTGLLELMIKVANFHKAWFSKEIALCLDKPNVCSDKSNWLQNIFNERYYAVVDQAGFLKWRWNFKINFSCPRKTKICVHTFFFKEAWQSWWNGLKTNLIIFLQAMINHTSRNYSYFWPCGKRLIVWKTCVLPCEKEAFILGYTVNWIIFIIFDSLRNILVILSHRHFTWLIVHLKIILKECTPYTFNVARLTYLISSLQLREWTQIGQNENSGILTDSMKLLSGRCNKIERYSTLSGKNTQEGRSSTLILDSIISFSLVMVAWRAADRRESRSLFHLSLKTVNSTGVMSHPNEKSKYPSR